MAKNRFLQHVTSFNGFGSNYRVPHAKIAWKKKNVSFIFIIFTDKIKIWQKNNAQITTEMRIILVFGIFWQKKEKLVI